MNVRLYILQRATAALMAPFVLMHIAVIFYASHKGLSAADILGRTRGSVAWAVFYSAFVVAIAVHASIGLRTIATEWMPLRGATREIFSWGIGAALLLLGLRAVAAVVLP
jgi:fumarate reductase subunit C